MRHVDISERDLETAIEETLLTNRGDPDLPASAGIAEPRGVYQASANAFPTTPEASVTLGGYHKRRSDEYDRALCLMPRDVLDFIYATQPTEWATFLQQHDEPAAKSRLLQRIAQEAQSRGTLDVLRHGVKVDGCRFRLAYFRPASGLNAEHQRLYAGNIFAVTRQLHYSQRNENSLDMALFLNGVPLFTVELKNPLTRQTVQDAIRQYRQDRDPREPLFAFGRCLAHFAVDPDLVYMTTHLEGSKTRFLPFNQGRNGGAGNPPASLARAGFATAYLWERVWSRDSVLDLIQQFIQFVEEEDDAGRRTGKRSLIFPRYHQLETVRRLIADTRAHGTGHRYLIQHSAGSGKSNTIAWHAHQLSTLHDEQNRRVFDSIIVVSDRRVLDRQLQRAVSQFEHTLGVVENIDKNSLQLKDALEAGKTIIVTTLQKFPVIADQIEALPGKRFAVIIDEAHSSQSGESPSSIKLILTAQGLEEATEQDASPEEDAEDRIIREMQTRKFAPNASYYAFTATPKPKTLELFGEKRPDGRYEAFSVYSMRQAIEEGFILDVLANYTTYKAYWSLLKKVETDPRYDRRKAQYLLTQFVGLHSHTIGKKTAIMVGHFADHVAERIGGKAKAMIVTRSRLHTVRYKQAVDRYLAEQGYPFKALVAFSGTVKDGGADYTEVGMNGMPEAQTAEAFKRDDYRILIVANKFQTGFDQPLLHTMYVDKKLGGVNAVQTLSRLNRTHIGKDETMVLDFANEADEIQQAFAPYYEKTLLTEGTDPNLLYDLQTRLRGFDLYTEADVQRFATLYFSPTARQDRLHAALAPIVERFEAATPEDRVDFRGQLNDYVRLYAFLAQIIAFTDADIEKLYVFSRLLLRKLPISYDRLPLEVQQNIDIESYRVQRTSNGKIALPRGEYDVEPKGPVSGYAPYQDELETLSQIIQELNQRFGTTFTDDDKLCIRDLEQRLDQHPALEASVRANTPENARLTFNHVVNDLMQDLIDGHFKFYKQVTDDNEFSKMFLDWLFERFLNRSQTTDQTPPLE